jgi:flagellar biosynthesis protein
VPDARPRAAALRYDGSGAPRVVAEGRGAGAERIVAAARLAGVPVREDRALAEALGALDLGAEVPEQLWRAVAEAIAWAWRLAGDGVADATRGPASGPHVGASGTP